MFLDLNRNEIFKFSPFFDFWWLADWPISHHSPADIQYNHTIASCTIGFIKQFFKQEINMK